jgi:hypothetical protein
VYQATRALTFGGIEAESQDDRLVLKPNGQALRACGGQWWRVRALTPMSGRIDETGAATNMTRRYGRYPRGRRLLFLLSGNFAKRRPSLQLCRWAKLPSTACSTAAWMARVSVPISSNASTRPYVKAISSSSTVSQPQSGRHQTPHRSRRCRPALPSHYSPDINPIEQLFTRIKALLRKATGRTPRCPDRGYC